MQANIAVPSIHVESQGIGRSLVLLHGFAMHSGLFAPIMPALSLHHRVHAVDLPGHGRSPPVDDGDVSSLVDAIDGAIDEAPLDVLGWSLGGEIALAWALARPSRIRRLVLVATTPSFVVRDDWPHAITSQTLSRFGDELRVSYRLTLARFLALQVHGSEAGRATLAALRARLYERGEPSKEALDAAIDMLRNVDLRPNLPRIRTPALVVAGDRDTLVPIAATRSLAAALPNATHVTIGGAAHAPFLSHRDAFERAVLPFLDA
ncbi:MAG TPA: pimeloyl-ACP methyl ester esterase BioH [Casimicrobiaceae bacterium]|nr:pimeloyl-ACP methyl ester esterase BioH [Casimicrobiaceae bacterium]